MNFVCAQESRGIARLGWLRVCAALLFLLHVGYHRVHMVVALHDDELGVAHAHDAADHGTAHHHHHNTDGEPHSSAEHALNLVLSKQPTVAPVLAFVDSEVLILSRPEAEPPVADDHRLPPPHESLAEPRKPRGPPIA